MIPDSLQTIAEIGIGLAGFSGLVVALRRNSGPLDDVQKFRMRILFSLTFGVMFLALLPDALVHLGVPDERIWFDSSAAMLAYSLWFMFSLVSGSRRIARVAPEIFNWTAFATVTAGHTIVVLLQFAVLLGLFESRAVGMFNLGLLWYLVHAAYQFVRMLFIQLVSSQRD